MTIKYTINSYHIFSLKLLKMELQLTEKQQKAQEVMNNIISKCWEDKTFKQQLVANPVATIEKFTGKPTNIPKSKELVVIDQTDNRYIYFNIPTEPKIEEMELTDEQLELVSGGILPLFLAGYSVAIAVCGLAYAATS